MDERSKEVNEKIPDAKQDQEFILVDAMLNVHVNKKYLFPYNGLDLMRNILGDAVKDYTIYFVMSCGRKEIRSVHVNNVSLVIQYMNMDSGEVKQLTYDMCKKLVMPPHLLRVVLPFFEYKICKSGATCKIYMPHEKMIQVKEKYPEIYCKLLEVLQKNNVFPLELDIYYLIWENQGDEKDAEKYDLLYIGKSNAEKSDFDILNRLSAHKTIQKITRDNNLYYRSKDLLLMIFSFNSKLYLQRDVNKYNISLVLGDSDWQEHQLLANIKENQEVILLIEAILIYYFKPKYNQQYVDQIPIKSKIYQEFQKQKVNPVSVELDLSIAQGKVQLKTKEEQTETKLRILKCYEEGKTIRIAYDDIPDSLYDADDRKNIKPKKDSDQQ